MGVEDWETKYKFDDILDDYLEPEQKTWDNDDETKSEIYRIVNNPGDSKRSNFYQTMECEVASPEPDECDETGNSIKMPGVESGEVHLVCKETGSFEDETSPPEISIIPSAKKLHQQEADREAYKESLLYKTRMWAKTHIEDILANYAIYREKEEARMRTRSEYESVGSEAVQVSLGSEEDLDVVSFIEEDTQFEYDSYYNSRKYISSYGERPHSYYGLMGNVSTQVLDDVSSVKEPSHDYIDTMNELQNIVDTVTEYLAGREEEISKYEAMHKSDNKSKTVDNEKDKDIKSDEVKEESTVEQGITGVTNAMNSLFSSVTGTKATGETTDTTAMTTTTTTTTCSPLPLQPESSISKLLSFIPKSNGSPTPVAVVPPAHQEPSADKKFPLQSVLPLQSSETSHLASVEGAEDAATAATSPETQGSTPSQSQSVVDSVLGRLSPFRIFGDKPSATSQPGTPNKSHGSTESKEGLTDKAKTLSIEQSASQSEHQSSCGGSCSGSVELLPETESSGEIPDSLPREMTLKPEENPTTQKTSDDTGFFSPFKKSLTSFMTTTPSPVDKTAEGPSGNSVFSIFKPTEAPKPEDVPATIGDKLKLSFFCSDTPATPQAPKQESGFLSGLLKLGPGEDPTASKQGASHTSTKSPLLSHAVLLESVPKGNTDTGWFSNLFKMSPAESPKPQTVAKFPSKPSATINKPTVAVVSEAVEDSTTVSKDVAQEEQMAQEDATPKSETDIQSVPESLTDTENEGQCLIKTETHTDPSELQDQAQPEEEAISKHQGLLTVLSGGNKTSDKPQESGLLSTLFSSLTSTTNKSPAQQGATNQSTGLFSGLLKMAATENASTDNNLAGTQQHPINSESQLGSTSIVGGQKQSQEQKATSQKGFLAGLFGKGSEDDSSSKLKDTTGSNINDETSSSVGKDLLSGIFKSEGNESSRTAISKDSVSTDTAALPQGGGVLSGLFKLANDTVSSSPATPAQQNSQPLLKPATTQGSNQPTATPLSHPGGLLSGLFKLAGTENVYATGDVVLDQQLEQPGNCSGQQPNHKQPNTQSNAPPVPPQSGRLFGGIQKLTESALTPSSTQKPSGTSSQPSQQSTESFSAGGMLSRFLNKISVAESTHQQLHLPATSQDPKSSQQSGSAEQVSFLSGLFGSSTSEVNNGNQVSPQNVKSQQFNRQNLVPNQEAEPNRPAGILSDLFNKIVDTASQSGQSDPNQNSAQPPSLGILSRGFSTNKPPAQQQKAPSGTEMKQQQQSNKQPLQRQHQIPVQPAAAPEPQQGHLFSGLFNKLSSTDTPPQHLVAEASLIQQACRSGHTVQGRQSPPTNQILTEVFKASTVTAASKKLTAEQQQPSIGLHQQSNRQAQQAPKAPQPPGAAQQQSQSGGLFSSIFKMSTSEELQQDLVQSNTQTANKLEAQNSDAQESGILSGFFSKISAKAEDKSDSHIPSGQKPQQHEEYKPGQNRPQIQRAKPIQEESVQDGGNEKDQKAPLRKGFLAGLFSKGSEDDSLSKLKETNEPKASFSAGKGMPSGIFKSEASECSKSTVTKEPGQIFIDQLLHKRIISDLSCVTSISSSKTSTQTQEPVTLHSAVKSTQLYLEEVHRLLYGTATEYGYQDLLYLFAEHGIVAPELYEHQCLIEALLWQQLNDYALLEALEAQAQVQEYYAGLQEDASSNSHETVMQDSGWWSLKKMDPRQFHVPSYPWQNVVSSSFQKRLPHADAEDDIVFDMSIKSRKLWGSCDNVDHFSNQTSRNHQIERDSTGTPAKLTRCHSHIDCNIYGKSVQNCTLESQFDTSKLLERLTVKKGPIDLTACALDLSSFSATTRDTEYDMFFEDSEWYQQWLSLLDQGMWWPAEAGDCGYYIYADGDYIYSLLTDQSGKNLYAYATQDNRHGLEEIAENISNILQNKDKPKTTLCGFKIPLFNEDEMLWVPCHSQAGDSNSPVDLSSAFEKGDIIMNMNLECFSEMLRDSISGQAEHPVDLSVYKLQKIKVGKHDPKAIHPKAQMEASDLTSKVEKVNNGGPYWKNQGIKDLSPGELVKGVSANISSQTSSVTYRQHSSIRCHPPIPEIKTGLVGEHNKKDLLNGFGAKTKDVESSKMTVISIATNSNLSGFKIVPQSEHAQRKLPDAPVSSKASTNSDRSLPATPRNIVTEPSIVTTTSSQMTLLTPQRSTSSLQCSSGSSSSAVSHRPQLGRQSAISTQCLKTSRSEGVQSPTGPILPQLPKVATCYEKRPLPPPQNLLYNRPKQALDSLLRSKPLDFSESLRNTVKCPGKNTALLLPDLSNEDITIEDILDFTKNRLKKVRKKHQWTCQADTSENVGIDLTVEIKEEVKEINMTFPAVELSLPFPIVPEVPLRTVSAPPSPRFCPSDSGPSTPNYRTDQHSSSSPNIGSKLVRQVSVQCSKESTTPEISGRKLINTSPKLSPNISGCNADSGKDQKTLIVSTHQGTSSSQPTSPEIKKYSTINVRSQSTQRVHQPSLFNKSMKIIPTPPQPCCKSTTPANLVRNTLDMSSVPVDRPLDMPTAETQVVPLVRSRRTSVADIGNGSFGVPLIVDPFTVQVKQIQSEQQTMTGNVPPLKSNTKTSQVSPVLCRQQLVYNRNRDLSAHFSQSCQNVSAPVNSITTTLDMCSKPAEEIVVSSDEAVSLVKRRSRSTSGIIEEFGGISLVVEPLTTKVKPPLRKYRSQATITKLTQQMENMTPQIQSVTQNRTNLYSLALKGTVTTSANPLKATLDMSANLVSKTTEGTETPHIEMLPVVGKVKKVLEASEVTVGLSSIMQNPTPEVKPMIRKYQSVETISQYSSQNAKENKTPSALTPANMAKVSLDMSLKPSSNTSSSVVMPLVKNKPSLNIPGPVLGVALPVDRSLKDLSQTKHSMVKLEKTNSNTDVQALHMFTDVPSMVKASEQPKKLDTLHRELNKNQWQKQVLFDQTLPGTPSLVLRSRSPSAQLANIPSAPANSIKNTLDMSLRTTIKESSKAAERILEMSPDKVMALVQTKNVISKKDLVGMPLIVKAISASEQVSQKQLQAEKVLSNGHHTAEVHLCLQTSTYHSDGLFYPALIHNGELQAQSKPMDFSGRVSHSQDNDLSNMQDGQLMDFTKSRAVISRNKQRLRTTYQKSQPPIIDLTVALDAKTQMSGIKDLSVPMNSFLPGQYTLTSLAMDQMRICTVAQCTLQALGRQEPYITQSQNTYPTLQPAAPTSMSVNFRTTAEHLENNFNMADLQILPEHVFGLSVEQKKITESSLPQAQLTDKNLCLEKTVISDGSPVFKPVTNSSEVLRVERSPLSTSQAQHIRPTQTQGPNITRHPLIVPKFMQHDSLITQVTECNISLKVSRSKGLVKQSTVESLRENTVQSCVPNLSSPTYVPEIPHVLNTSKASDIASVVTIVSGQDVSSMTNHGQEHNNGSKLFTALATDITPCTTEQAVGQDMSQGTVIFAQSGSTCTGSSAEPERKSLLAINTVPKTQISSRQTLLETENTTRSVRGLFSKFDGTTSIAGEDKSPERSEGIQQRTGFICRLVPDQQMTPVPTHPATSAKVTSVKSLVSKFMADTSSTTPACMVQSSMENPPVKNLSSPVHMASGATEFSKSSPLPCQVYNAPPPIEFPPAHAVTPAIRFSPPLPLPSPSPVYTAPTPIEFSPSSVYTVESKAYPPIERLPSSLPPPSPVCTEEACTPVECPACNPVEPLTCSGHVVPLPMEPPPASLLPSTEYIASLPMEFSSLMLQNISHTASPSIVLTNDKQCTFPTPGSVLDTPNSPLLQRKIPVYHQSKISRHVSKAPTIIVTEVEVESPDPSSVILAQPDITEKEADLLVSKTNCEPSLMISDTSTNTMWDKSISVVTDNDIHIAHMPQQIIPNNSHCETCSKSSKSQEDVRATELASKRDVSEGNRTDSDIFSQKQSTVGSISSEMLFFEEVPCFVAVSPTEVKEKTLHFIRLCCRQMLIPQITLKHPKEGCPSDEETLYLHGTGDDTSMSVTEACEDVTQPSVLFEKSEAAVSVPEECKTSSSGGLSSQINKNQVDSNIIIVPVASTEVSESNINVPAKTSTSLTPTFSNIEEQVSHSLLVQDTTSHKKVLLPARKEESMIIKSGKVLGYQNKDIFSFEPIPLITDIMFPELIKSPEDAKEKSEIEDQKFRPGTLDITKPMKEEDAEVSAGTVKEPVSYNAEHLTSESPKPKNRKGPSDFGEISVMSKEQEGVKARLHKLLSPEAPVLSTDVLSMKSSLPPTAVPEEQSGKVIFSLFGGSSCAPSQTQSGSSILGGILPGASTSKETTGTSLFSMFGGASPQQTQASSAPKELLGKKLLSMFSGSNVKQTLGPHGPSGLGPRGPPGFDTREQVMSGPTGTPGPDHRGGPGPGPRSPSGPGLRGSSTVGLPPRGQQPMESQGKGIFSMFSGPLYQQTLASGAPPRSPASGAPILAGILPGPSTPKDNIASGLFSIFGGSSDQSFPTEIVPKCSNKEPAGKSLFSRFGGTASSKSESLFKVPSVFSLGDGSDKPKMSGFGLLPFMDDKKSGESIPEDKATTKLEVIARESTSMDGEIKYVKSSHGKPKESEQDLPNNSVSTANENYEKVITETEIKSAHAILNPEDGMIHEYKTIATSEVTHSQTIKESETKIKTVENPTEEKQQSLETEKTDEFLNVVQNQEDAVIPEDKTLTSFEATHAQITEKSETESKTVEHPTEGQSQKQEYLETEKPLDSEQNHTKELESDTGKDTGRHTYSVESPKAEKTEKFLESEKTAESDETIEAQIPQKLNKSVDYVSHIKIGEIAGTLEESQDREFVDNKIPAEIPERLEESWEREETQNQDESEKGRPKTDKEADHAEQPKIYPCDSVVEKEPAQVKEQEATEKQLTDMPAQIVSEPLSAVIIQVQPQSQPEMIRSLDKPKTRMVERPGQLRLEMQGHHTPNIASFQRPSESTAFSGFKSMFSGPSASSKPATSSFFISPQHSFFNLQPTGATCAQQQHKTSFFNLPTNLPAGLSTESLTGDLFGLLKTKDAARPEETKSAMKTCKLKNEEYEGAKNFNKPRCSTGKESSTVREPETVVLEEQTVKICERSDVEPVDGERDGNIEITDMPIKCKKSEAGVMKEESRTAVTSPIPIDRVAQEKHPSSPTAKSMFDLSGLSAPSFGSLLSGAAETAKPFSSLFGSSTDINLPQKLPDSGSLFASFKGFSAGLFQEQKSALPNEELMSAPSMFGKKLGFPWQSTAPSQTPSTVVNMHEENKNNNQEPEIETLSLESDITESPDSSDTEGPTDTYKQQSFNSSPESLLAVKQDMSKPGEEDEAEADPSLKEKDRGATDHSMGQLPDSPPKKEHGRRLVGT